MGQTVTFAYVLERLGILNFNRIQKPTNLEQIIIGDITYHWTQIIGWLAHIFVRMQCVEDQTINLSHFNIAEFEITEHTNISMVRTQIERLIIAVYEDTTLTGMRESQYIIDGVTLTAWNAYIILMSQIPQFIQNRTPEPILNLQFSYKRPKKVRIVEGRNIEKETRKIPRLDWIATRKEAGAIKARDHKAPERVHIYHNGKWTHDWITWRHFQDLEERWRTFVNRNRREPNFIYLNHPSYHKIPVPRPTPIPTPPLRPVDPKPIDTPTTATGRGIHARVLAIARHASRLRYERGFCSNRRCIVRRGKGDCWAMSYYLHYRLEKEGINARILNYPTRWTQNHRHVQYHADGRWHHVPYRKAGIDWEFSVGRRWREATIHKN